MSLATHPATTQTLFGSEFQHHDKTRVTALTNHARGSSADLFRADAEGALTAKHLLRDAGGRVRLTPFTHDVGNHETLQVLLDEPIMNYGI